MAAQRAYELGLVDEIAEPEDLMELAMSLADSIAANSPTAVSLSQQAIWGSLELPYEEALERAWEMVKAHRGHPDAAEGPRAFVEKRPPRWAALSGATRVEGGRADEDRS
jgi:enoyl-CoA hydratase/carnithine racemase